MNIAETDTKLKVEYDSKILRHIVDINEIKFPFIGSVSAENFINNINKCRSKSKHGLTQKQLYYAYDMTV